MLDKTDDVGPGDEAEALETDAAEFNPRLETLRGDLRDVMLGRVRTTRKPWEQMTEAEQTDLANGLDLAPVDITPDQPQLELEDGEGVPDPTEAELPLEGSAPANTPAAADLE